VIPWHTPGTDAATIDRLKRWQGMRDQLTRDRSPSAGLMIAVCLVMLVVSSSSCARGRGDSRVVVHDSAGITIVESREGSWGTGQGWTLSEEPVAVIGTADGPDAYSLYHVRAALLLPDRRILIANSGTDELRYYDSSGTHLYSVGRDGFGPGEFKRIYWVWLARDSLVVFDDGQDRVSVFSASGTYGRTLMLDRAPSAARPLAWGAFADGSMLGLQLLVGGGTGFRRERVEGTYWRYSPDGDVLDSIGRFLIADAYSESRPGSQPGMAMSVSTDAPFGQQASTIVFGQHLYHASSETYDIQVFDSGGHLQRIIRRPVPNRPVTGSDIEAFKESFLEGSEPDGWARRRVNDLEFPETMPAYGAVKVDALGNVWVAEYSLGHEDRTGRWTVFDTDGRMLGVVQVPTGGRLRDIGDDYLIGTWRTDLGVEQVRMYRLFRK
jgi:hypothetical protein